MNRKFTVQYFALYSIDLSLHKVCKRLRTLCLALDGPIRSFRIARPHHPSLRDPRLDRESVFQLKGLTRLPTALAFSAESTPLLFDRNQPLCPSGGAPSDRVNE